MKLEVPYRTSGQELGETRAEMAKRLMKDIDDCVNKMKHVDYKYYILVHGKNMNVYIPEAEAIYNQAIKIKIVYGIRNKPPMMLSCMLFGVDNQKGQLTLEWSLPGDWPVWSVGGTNEPIPEVIGSLKELGVQYNLDDILKY